MTVAVLALALLAAAPAVTLDQALNEARQANAQLPPAREAVAEAGARAEEARAQRLPAFSVFGDTQYGLPLDYSDQEIALHAGATWGVFHGGERRARLRAELGGQEVARAALRLSERALELQVRLRYAELVELDDEVRFRADALARLRDYLERLQARAASGEPVGADELRTHVRVGEDEAAALDLQRARDDAAVALNVLMGRPPRAPLSLAPLPFPSSPVPPAPAKSELLPDLARMQAEIQVAAAQLDVARAARLPWIDLQGQAGAVEPFFGSTDLGPTASQLGAGFFVALTLRWPVFQFGALRAAVAAAEHAHHRAELEATATERAADQSAATAQVDLANLFALLKARAKLVPEARDAFLQAQTRYLGGVGTALDVLDSYRTWVDAQVAEAGTLFSYRRADAERVRWEGR